MTHEENSVELLQEKELGRRHDSVHRKRIDQLHRALSSELGSILKPTRGYTSGHYKGEKTPHLRIKLSKDGITSGISTQ